MSEDNKRKKAKEAEDLYTKKKVSGFFSRAIEQNSNHNMPAPATALKPVTSPHNKIKESKVKKSTRLRIKNAFKNLGGKIREAFTIKSGGLFTRKKNYVNYCKKNLEKLFPYMCFKAPEFSGKMPPSDFVISCVRYALENLWLKNPGTGTDKVKDIVITGDKSFDKWINWAANDIGCSVILGGQGGMYQDLKELYGKGNVQNPIEKVFNEISDKWKNMPIDKSFAERVKKGTRFDAAGGWLPGSKKRVGHSMLTIHYTPDELYESLGKILCKICENSSTELPDVESTKILCSFDGQVYARGIAECISESDIGIGFIPYRKLLKLANDNCNSNVGWIERILFRIVEVGGRTENGRDATKALLNWKIITEKIKNDLIIAYKKSSENPYAQIGKKKWRRFLQEAWDHFASEGEISDWALSVYAEIHKAEIHDIDAINKKMMAFNQQVNESLKQEQREQNVTKQKAANESQEIADTTRSNSATEVPRDKSENHQMKDENETKKEECYTSLKSINDRINNYLNELKQGNISDMETLNTNKNELSSELDRLCREHESIINNTKEIAEIYNSTKNSLELLEKKIDSRSADMVNAKLIECKNLLNKIRTDINAVGQMAAWEIREKSDQRNSEFDKLDDEVKSLREKSLKIEPSLWNRIDDVLPELLKKKMYLGELSRLRKISYNEAKSDPALENLDDWYTAQGFANDHNEFDKVLKFNDACSWVTSGECKSWDKSQMKFERTPFYDKFLEGKKPKKDTNTSYVGDKIFECLDEYKTDLGLSKSNDNYKSEQYQKLVKDTNDKINLIHDYIWLSPNYEMGGKKPDKKLDEGTKKKEFENSIYI